MLAAVAVAALVGCKPAVPPVPGKGGPPWTELTSEHFTLWTDASPRRGRELVRELEHLRQVVYGVAFPGLPPGGRGFVVALRDADEVGAFLPPQFQAYAWLRPLMRQPMIVLAADTDEDDGHVIAHELTHLISWGAIRRQPDWFAEGMARFFETVQLDASRRSVEVGEPLPSMVRGLRWGQLRPAAEVMACTVPACKDERFYTTVWAIYAFLANTRPGDLLRFQAGLDVVDDPVALWRDVFPDLPPRELDGAVRRWLTGGRHQVWRFDVSLAEPTMVERPVTDAEVYAIRAVIRHEHAPDDPRVARDVAAALALDPTEPIARTVQVALGQAISVEEARAVVAAHADDWRAWWLLAGALGLEGDEARAALQRVCALAATNPSIWSPWRCAP